MFDWMKSGDPRHRAPMVAVTWLCAVGVIGWVAGASQDFSDGEFLDADWQDELIIDSSGSASYQVQRIESDGNPGAYRQVLHSWPAQSEMGVAHVRTVAQYDPSVDGAVSSIAYSFDLFNQDTGVNSDVVGYGLLIVQDGNYYHRYSGAIADSGVWTPFAEEGLTPADFALVSGTGPKQPDFSCTGAVMTFGYLSTNNSSGQFPTLDSGIDNWSVSIESAGACVADISGNDGSVDTNDLLLMLANWGTPNADVTCDGLTDISDLLLLLAEWGPCS